MHSKKKKREAPLEFPVTCVYSNGKLQILQVHSDDPGKVRHASDSHFRKNSPLCLKLISPSSFYQSNFSYLNLSLTLLFLLPSFSSNCINHVATMFTGKFKILQVNAEIPGGLVRPTLRFLFPISCFVMGFFYSLPSVFGCVGQNFCLKFLV